MENTKIEWADHTFNAWWGCTKVSQACKYCYAETLSKRFNYDLWGDTKPRKMTSESYWKNLAKWDKAAAKAGVKHRIFVNSMSDVYEDRADLIASRERLFDAIEGCKNLIFMLLTKRPENIMPLSSRWKHGFPENVWVGVTAENQEMLDKRVPTLIEVPCAVKFLSCEPLLGHLRLEQYLLPNYDLAEIGFESWANLHWVIVGGESGANARPMDYLWVDDIFNQCADAGTPFFFKQWGSCVEDSSGTLVRSSKASNGRTFRDKEWNEIPN